MARTEESAIRVHVHGLRNQAAEFEGGEVELLVGSMGGPSYAGDQLSVLLTVEGRDKGGKVIDIEIAVPVDQVRELVGRILDRSGITS